MVEFSLVSYEVIHSGIEEPVHRRTSQPTSAFECRSSVEKVRFGFDPFAEHPATANVEGRGFSLVGFVNHSPAARKPSLGRNLDGSKGAHVMRCDAVSGLRPYERYRKSHQDVAKADRPSLGVGREFNQRPGLRGSFYRRKPPSGNVRKHLAIPFRRQHRGVEFVLASNMVDVDEAETPQGAPVVGSDPVTEVRQTEKHLQVAEHHRSARLPQSQAATRIASDISAKSRDQMRTMNMGKSRRCQAIRMRRHPIRSLVRSPAVVM